MIKKKENRKIFLSEVKKNRNEAEQRGLTTMNHANDQLSPVQRKQSLHGAEPENLKDQGELG